MEVQHQVKRTLRAPAALARVRALLALPEVEHRSALAERVCAEFGFFDARGRAQRGSCLKALRELERGGHFALPAPLTRPGRAGVHGPGEAVALAHEGPARLEQVEGLELVLVQTGEQRALWNVLLAHEHPRGAGPLVGCQLRYLVGSAHGWLGALGFGAAALTLRAREHWIGWDVAQRRAHLHRVMGLNRFQDVAALIDEVTDEWKAQDKRTRRNWWVILAGDIKGQPRTVAGRTFPALRAAQLRQGVPVTDNALRRGRKEEVPPVQLTQRWSKSTRAKR